ncbi:carboxypeptidase regulatory-like domain-containing protein [Bacteroidota bacterium]
MMVFLMISCAFSLSVSAQTTLITESFENGGSVPAGWAVEQVSGTCPTIFASTSSWPSGYTAYQGTWMARFQSWSYGTGVSRLKQTTPFSTVGYTNLGIDFAWLESTSYSGSADKVDVQWSTDGTTWNTAGTFLRYNPVQGWKIKNLTLPAGAQGQATVYIAFQFTSAYGNDCYLDLAHVTGIGPPAPQTVTIGTGTGTTYYPYLTYWHDGRTQLLYTAAEIIAAGGGPGEISTIGFDVSSYSSQLMNGFNIRMKNTTATTATAWDNSMTTVYTGTYAVPGTGWQMITLQTPFIWDGSNLLVEVCFDNTSYTSYSYVRYTTAASKALYYYTDGAAGCSFPSSYASSNRANLRMVVTPWVGTLTGTVTNCFNGAPLAGATVTAGTFSATTNASGVYTMVNVPVGNYNVTCTATGFLPQTKPATVNNQQTTTLNYCMEPIPAYLSGIVYNNDTGEPIVGAKIEAGGSMTYSVAGGQYTLNIYPVGTFGVTANKAGFNTFTAGPFAFQQGVTELLDIPMLRQPYAPRGVVATLNTTETAVDINWLAPRGNYEIRYDDGICDNFTVWAVQGNLNAVKFTPVGYPANVIGGKVHIGTIDNYPPGANPLVPFQMAIYDATGPAGMPGAPIGDPIDVTPGDYGWVDFSFPSTTIASGDFYLVMIQGGNAPNAAGICVDETSPQLRSYAKFETGGAPWIPASGNFMLRALVFGEGGPLVLDATPEQSEPITASAVPGATYNHTPETVTGVAGQGMFQTVEWSSFNPSNTELPYITGSDPNQATSDEYTGPATNFSGGVGIPLFPSDAVLYNNGPLVNSAGTGAGGADECILENPPLTTLGFGFQNAAGNYMADDFTVTGNSWSVTSMDFFGYQTGSTTTSTFTGVFVQIWNGEPGTAGATVIWGDRTTNRMASTVWSNIYRNSDGPGGATNRPIMKVVASTPGLTLAPGTYWVEFSTTGSAASGPWAPPISITGQYTTGNALQYTTSSGLWNAAISGATDQQGMPFLVNGFEITPAGDIDYQVWRLQQGEETNPGLWNSIGTTNTLMMTDNSWPSLSCGPYRWAVKAIYQGNRISAAAFSNVIGKCNTAEVTVNVLLTCAAHPLEGTQVQLINTVYPDTSYFGFTDTNGTVVFPTVWKGNYDLNVIRFTYPLTTQVVDVLGDMTIDMVLLQDKTPPTNLFVDDRSLESVWNSPKVAIEQFSETWNGGYTPNQWFETPANSNWAVATTFGNPAPSATFSWTPTVTGYEQFLTSNKVIPTVFAPSLTLQCDIYLSNFSNTTVENLAVEVYDGSWHTAHNWDNTGGNIAWSSETVDISAYAQSDIMIRFKAWGEDSYQINNWNVDNIYVVAGDGGSGYNPCVLGYNFYLNSVLAGFTVDTTYLIPANLVAYGQVYDACVNAVYGSGYSTLDCYTFTSHFLYPPMNLGVEAIECAAYLTWEKPAMIADVRIVDIQPRTNTPIASAEYSPFEITLEGQDYTETIWDILFSWDATAAGVPGIEADQDNIYLASWSVGPPWFYKHEKTTGTLVESFDIAGATAIRDMATDGQYFYGAAANTALRQMDFTTHTLVSTITIATASRHIAYDPQLDGGAGGFWCGDWNNVMAIAMDGSSLGNGPAVTSAYGSAWDNQSTGGPYLWVYTQTGANSNDLTQYAINYSPIGLTPTGVTFDVGTVPGFGGAGSIAGGLCATPVGTKYALVANVQQTPEFIVGLEIADFSGGGGDPPGLIGYNVYRDGNFIAYVSGKDTTWYYDFTVDPGTHDYAVTAWYDLTDYGFPGMFDESLIEGPESISIICGRDLPFCETWDQASFDYNEWTFGPDQGNWSVTTAAGNPAPSADFGWVPLVTDYSNALISPTLNAGPWNCATLWLDFDWKLVDRNATGNEYLTVEALWSGTWHEVAEFANNGDVAWTSEHIDITGGGGKAVKVRFTANGDNSEDILHWYVDNICVYGICNAPVDLELSYQSQNNVTLSWTAPECTSGGGGTVMQFIFDDGTAENGWAINPGFLAWMGTEFPIDPSMAGVVQSVDVWFGWAAGAPGLTVDIFDGSQNLVGSSDPFTTPSEDWLNVPMPDVPFSGPFYAMVKWDMLGAGTNFFGYDENGPYASTNLAWYYDGAAWDHMSSVAGTVPGVFMIRVTALVGGDAQQVLLVPGKEPISTLEIPQGVLNQSHQSFDTKNYQTMGVVDNADSALIMGYNVYRAFESDPYEMLNATPVTETTYDDEIDMTHAYGEFHYYVTTVYDDSETNSFLCESPESNIIDVMWPAVGIENLSSGAIRVFPNPATDIVNVKSDFTITSIEVMNFLGQSVYTQDGVDQKTMKINVSKLQAGVYFVKVTTLQGVRAVKITVTR